MNFDDSRWDIPIVDDRAKEKDRRGSTDPIDKGKSQNQEHQIIRDVELVNSFLSLGIEIEVANSIHDKYTSELSRLSELEKSKAMALTPQRICEWYFNPEPISLYGFLLREYLREDEEKNEISDREIDDEKNEISDEEIDTDTEQILDISDVPPLETQRVGLLEDRGLALPEIELPKSELIHSHSIDHIAKQKLELLQQGFDLGRKVFERRWTIADITKKAYGYDVERLQKKLGDSPTIPDVLKHILESARNDPEGSYFHVVSGIREGYPLLYKIIEKILPSKTERENMKHHAKLSGYDIRESRPIVEARQQEITPDMMSKLYERLNPKYIGAVKVIEYAWNRRNELNNMTIKLGSKRDVIELKFPVSKQKRQTKTNTIKIHKKFFPEAFADLGKILCQANGSKSVRQSSFEAVQPFPNLKMDTLEEAFKVARRRAGLPEWITLHSLKHQGITDARKGGLDDEGIAELTQHTDIKNVRCYGVIRPF